MMNKISRISIFIIGWILSPFTWWNDAFINIPLSYLMANILFYFIRVKFVWLVVFCYWLTNAIGLLLMYYDGRHLMLASKNRIRTFLYLVVFIIALSAVILYIDKQGKLLPIGVFLKRYFHG